MDFRVRKLKNIELNRLSIDAFKSQEKIPLVLILDNVRSMNNVGSIFRTCDCLGIGKIFLCGITGTPPHREIYKTSLGAENSIEWEYYKDIATLLNKLKSDGYFIAGLEQTDRSIDIRTFEWDNNPLAIVVGNEIEGLGNSVLELCDQLLEIPQYGTKHSYNVSVSAGIALWELVRELKTENNP